MRIIERIKFDLQDQGNARVADIMALVAYYQAAEAWIELLTTGDTQGGKEKFNHLKKARAELEKEYTPDER